MRRYILLLAAFIAVTVSFDLGYRLQTDVARVAPSFGLVAPLEAQSDSFRGFNRAFTAQTTTGATTGYAMRGIATTHTAHVIVTGGPATCTYRIQGSRDGTNWFNISGSDITCTATATQFTTGAPTVYIRGNLLTLTGGTSPTVTLHYIGK